MLEILFRIDPDITVILSRRFGRFRIYESILDLEPETSSG
jgi:hypothetical protein